MGLMEALSGWLKQIVAVVLLAGLVDLLLPNRTMQRYVRLIAGLIILLTIATPIMHGISSDFDSKLAAGVRMFEVDSRDTSNELARIEEEGRRWRQRSNEEAANLAASRLENAIRDDVRLVSGLDEVDVQVTVQQHADKSMEVQQVIVRYGAGNEASHGTDSDRAAASAGAEGRRPPIGISQVEAPQAVQPVIVKEVSRSRLAEPAFADADPDPALTNRITSLIAARYGIAAHRINVLPDETIAGSGR